MQSATDAKAKVETGVQIVERQILAVLRHQRFFSVAALNQAMLSLLTQLNAQPFQKLDGSRDQWFEAQEKKDQDDDQTDKEEKAKRR